MQLLVAVINDVDRVEEILEGFFEIGITGATLLSSEGMGRTLSQELPAFAGLQTLISRSRPQNRTLFSVIEDPRKVEEALAVLQKVCGSFDDAATGIAFTVPLSRVVGLAPELTPPEE